MSVMERLKEETWPLHQKAESHPLQKALVQGKLPKEAYAEHLGQMLFVHRALESALRDLASSDPRVAAVVTDEQYQEPYILEDLAAFGLDPASVEALDATKALVAKIERAAGSLVILGMHYVLEGSNNGNRFIAKAVMHAYRLAPGRPGLRYLDPYGDEQPAKWAAFKEQMNAAAFTEDETERLLEGANAMFNGITELSQEGWSRLEATPA